MSRFLAATASAILIALIGTPAFGYEVTVVGHSPKDMPEEGLVDYQRKTRTGKSKSSESQKKKRDRTTVGGAGKLCPVDGPTEFTDSYGDPRSGHVHEGVDMMSPTGTPVVAIVSGTITFAEYDESGGNILFLSGDDGNTYYYMHQNENFVTSGRVTAGQEIGTVGSTGNADSPHLHFEYHPGGGDSVNPYQLVSSLC